MNSCLRAVRWTHVRRQFLNLDKMQQSMSEGSSLVIKNKRIQTQIVSQLTDDLSKLTRTNHPVKGAESQ